MAEKKPNHKQGGLGRGLAALIPSAQDEDQSARPRLGNSAADVILGSALGDRGAAAGKNGKNGARKAVQGAETDTEDRADNGAGKDASKGAGKGAEGKKASGKSTVPGAPTIASSSSSAARSRGGSLGPQFGATYREVPVGQISPNPKQPRTVFDADDLAELVHSIKEFGLLQPIVVRPSEDLSLIHI